MAPGRAQRPSAIAQLLNDGGWLWSRELVTIDAIERHFDAHRARYNAWFRKESNIFLGILTTRTPELLMRIKMRRITSAARCTAPGKRRKTLRWNASDVVALRNAPIQIRQNLAASADPAQRVSKDHNA